VSDRMAAGRSSWGSAVLAPASHPFISAGQHQHTCCAIWSGSRAARIKIRKSREKAPQETRVPRRAAGGRYGRPFQRQLRQHTIDRLYTVLTQFPQQAKEKYDHQKNSKLLI